MSDYILEVASGDMGKQCVQLLKHYNKESCRNKIPEDVNEFELTSLQEAIKRGDRVNHRYNGLPRCSQTGSSGLLSVCLLSLSCP